MKNKATPKRNLPVIITDQDKDKLFEISKNMGTDISKLVRSWVEEELQKTGHTIMEEI